MLRAKIQISLSKPPEGAPNECPNAILLTSDEKM